MIVKELIQQHYHANWVNRQLSILAEQGIEKEMEVTNVLLLAIGNFLKKINKLVKDNYARLESICQTIPLRSQNENANSRTDIRTCTENASTCTSSDVPEMSRETICDRPTDLRQRGEDIPTSREQDKELDAFFQNEILGVSRQIKSNHRKLVGSNGELVGINGELVGINGELVGSNGKLIGINGKLVGNNRELVGSNRELVGINGELVGISRTAINVSRTAIGAARYASENYVESVIKGSETGIPKTRQIEQTTIEIESTGVD